MKNVELSNKAKIGILVAGAATLISAGTFITMKSLRKKNGETPAAARGSFYAAKDTILIKDKTRTNDYNSETMMVYKGMPLEGVVFEDGWFKVKVLGREGYLPKNAVYYFYEDEAYKTDAEFSAGENI